MDDFDCSTIEKLTNKIVADYSIKYYSIQLFYASLLIMHFYFTYYYTKEL